MPTFRRNLPFFVMVVCLIAFVSSVSAQRTFYATLDGAQEVPPNASAATGTGIVVLNAAETQVTVTLNFSGLGSAQTAAHIHGASPRGVASGVFIGFGLGSFTNQVFAISPTQVAALKAGLTYFNVHSSGFPGGEIRGQIEPACEPSVPGLISWWSGDGNALDSRSRNNGTLQNGVTFAAGQNGQAFSLDGTDDFVRVPHNTNLNVTQFTLETWVKPNQPTGTLGFIYTKNFNGNGFNDPFSLFIDGTAGGIGGRMGSGGGENYVFSTAPINDNNFHHLALTFDGASLRLYRDGILDDTEAISFPVLNNTHQAEFGGWSSAGVPNLNFKGLIDEPSIYNRALSATEIASIAAAGPSGKCKPTATISPANQIGWWGGDANANDISGGVLNGILQNGTGFAVGKVGQAFSFDGIDDHVSFTGPPTAVTDNWTMEAWINPANLPQLGMVMSNGFDNGTSGDGYAFGIANGCTSPAPCGTGNRLQGLLSGVAFMDGGFTFPSTNQWYHVVMLRESGTVKFFVNGVQTPGTSTITPAVPTQFRIGSQNGIRFFSGLIDEPAVYNRALSPSEIQSIVDAGVAGKLKSAITLADLVPVAGLGIRKDTETKAISPVAPQAIQTIGDVTISLPNVTVSGVTQQIPLAAGSLPTLPSGMTLTGLAYDISTSAVFTGNATLCFRLPAFAGLTPTEFHERRILHLVNGAWVDRTSAYAFATRAICATSPTLSPFAIVDSNLAPVAAAVSVSGRVTTSNGNGLRGAVVTMTGADGITRRAITSSFGHYRFDDITVGETYVIGVASKRYVFSPRTITVADELSDVDFVAE